MASLDEVKSAATPQAPGWSGAAPMRSRMRFKGAWRDYQSHVLDEMDARLADGRLHVVAPPGAGKTVLGLEIVRRLGRPALIFAPTVAIRDQWTHRLTPLFLDAPPGPDEVSQSLTAPREFTVATYQALDPFRRAEDIGRLAQTLNANGPLTLVLDEAHHLRREWCESIEQLAAALSDVCMISLTATPPYDASAAEWARYERLCGPVDLEIGAPELVRNGDLCPHQDHVILSTPTADALTLLDRRRRAVMRLQQDLWADRELLDLLEGHPWLQHPEAHVEAILEAPEMLSAVLILLAWSGRRLPRAPLKLLGVSRRGLPGPSFFWLERFLDGVMNSHAATFDIGHAARRELRERLNGHGLIEGGRVRLGETRAIFSLMAASLAKLESIADIARAERAALGAALRMVILSDHIRAGELPTRADADFRPSKLGVVPIFEHLRRQGIATEGLGVLTGALVILPRPAMAAADQLLAELGLDHAALKAFEMPGCPGHVRVELAGGSGARLVQLVTALFAHGHLQILVGTQSLLGEGWDAPTLNSLVLASNTSSFMLSNQMRGRAIRIDPAKTDKVANIWHLATVAPPARNLPAEGVERLNWGQLMDDGPADSSDAALLARRFRAFEGVANGESTLIESGIGRLGVELGSEPRAANARTFAIAADRAHIARRWSQSLGAGGLHARVRQTAAPDYAPRVLAWSETLHALAWTAASGAAFAAAEQLAAVDPLQDLSTMGIAVAGAAALASLPKLARGVRLVWRNGTVENSLGQVGRAILEALFDAGLTSETDVRNGVFDVRSSIDGRKDVVLRGVTRTTERQVIQALAEVLGPVQNPRYLLVRRSRLLSRTRGDYHAVPEALGLRKERAERFAKLWNRDVGPSELVYTRTPEGRRVLLQARAKSLAAGLQRSVERRSAWL